MDRTQNKIIDYLVIALIGALIFIPDAEAVTAQLFMGDYFHNWDVIFMGTVYAMFQGLVPGIDVNATYGLGLTVLIEQVMRLLGGFDYPKALIVFYTCGIAYFIAWYALLRRLLNSQWLAIAAIMLIIRAHMFISILVPFAWNEVQSSVMRILLDAVFFWCLFVFCMNGKRAFFWALLFAAGIAMYYMPTTGIFLSITSVIFIAARVLHAVRQENMKLVDCWLSWIRPMIVIPAVAFGLYVLTVKSAAFQGEFWFNMAEWSKYFTKGFFYSPLLAPVKGGDYVLVLGGLGYCMLYLATMLFTGYRCFKGKAAPRDWFILCLSIYGAGLFTYYIGMSHKYLSVGLPGIVILLYWIDRALLKSQHLRKPVTFAILSAALILLITSKMLHAYPNALNFSRNPVVDPKVSLRVGNNVPYFHQLSAGFPDWIKLPVNSLGDVDEQFKFEHHFINHDALKSYYRLETAFAEDADLIKRLTPPQARVPLLASFEVMMLSKAERRPFFYYFPLLNSHPLRMRNFVVTTVFSYTQINKCIQQIEAQKPPYIFMEKIFLTQQVPPWYMEEYEDLIALIRHVKTNYTVDQAGKFLVAMKRKANG